MKLFTKNLTATDCLKRLCIPRKVLTSLPEFHGGHAVELQVRCETMEYWPLICTIRKKGRYKKPVISKRWRKFVLANKLSVGDELTFHKEENQESSSLHYRVEVKRGASWPSMALSRSPSLEDQDVQDTTSTVINCTDQSSREIRSHGLMHQFGTVRSSTGEVTCETSNTRFKQPRADTGDVMGVNKYSQEVKLFGAIIGVARTGG